MSRASQSKVLVTPRSFGRGDDALQSELTGAVGAVEWRQGGDLDPDTLRELVADVDGWIAGLETIDRSILEAAGRLKVIARYGVGVDGVDLAAAAERGIVVTNTPGANAGAVAELVVGLMLGLARQIPQADRAVREHVWGRVNGVALEGKVIGLLGFGAIGREVARRLTGMGCDVCTHDPAPDAVEAAATLGVRFAGRDEVIATSDFLSLHMPVLPETRGSVDAAFLAAMKPGAFLVNAARGELIDEAALIDALDSGHLAGAALDALAQEPPPEGFALGRMDTVILTPHLGAHTDHAVSSMGRAAMENCLAVLRGEQPLNPVAPPTKRRT
jgi:phosphoglycerate dehydrogenase-like enzyme